MVGISVSIVLSMHRVEIYLKSYLSDARGLSLVKDIYDLGVTTGSSVRVVDIYWLDADLVPDELDLICHCLLADPVTQDYRCEPSPFSKAPHIRPWIFANTTSFFNIVTTFLRTGAVSNR